MIKLTPEAKVGIFIFAGLVLLVAMSLWLGGMKFAKERGYEVTVSFPSAGGLDRDAAVAIAGVEVGRVKEIRLEDNKAKLVLELKKGVRIGTDFVAMMKTSGLLGEKYVELVPGAPDAPLVEPGGEITRVMSYTDMDALITTLDLVAKDIKNVTESLNAVLGGEEGEATLRNIVYNVEDLTGRINDILARNDEHLASVMENMDALTGDLRNESPAILKSLREVTEGLNAVIGENRENLKGGLENLVAASAQLEKAMENLNRVTAEVAPKVSETVESIGSVAKKIDEGEGTIGKLVNDPETHDNINRTLTGISRYIEKMENFRTFVSYRGEYLFDEDDFKNYLSLRIQPRSDKYYLFEIVDNPQGFRRKETVDTVTNNVKSRVEITTTSDDLLFSVQLAKRFRDLVLRGGMIESTGGFGMDYYFLDDRLKLTFEAFDFDVQRNPHLKAGLLFYLTRHFYLSAGYDDFISRMGLDSGYVGLGFQFEDEDLKYLLGSVPAVSF
jgi:phospholipid/cholesterol/gamma-HCH transport system substrate-binding protein